MINDKKDYSTVFLKKKNIKRLHKFKYDKDLKSLDKVIEFLLKKPKNAE